MSFTDIAFFAFVGITVLVYFITPKRFRWVTLLVASMLFYWINSGWLLLILLGTCAVTFGCALWIEASNKRGKEELKALGQKAPRAEKKAQRAKTKRRSRRILAVGVVLVVGALLLLKYYDFFADNAAGLLKPFGIRPPHFAFLLPLGISFYTLQAIAYMTDVFRGKATADRNFFKFTLFMSFFPQIVQGPIPRHGQLAKQLYEPHSFDYTRLCHGAQLALWGLFQKMVIADRIAIPVGQVFDNYTQYHGLMLFLAAAGYGLQVYTDFSGGMDIARGVAQMMGIELELNFKQPYFSISIEDFWRRWHITLGSWMKNYVFYPLSLSKAFAGLSRKSRRFLGDFVGKRLPPILAMFTVYFLVGFWHGPDWKYIVYGVWNGIFLVMGILLPEQYAKWADRLHINRESFYWRSFQIVRTFAICSLGRLFSRGETLEAAWQMFISIFTEIGNLTFLSESTRLTLGLTERDWMLLFAAVMVLLWVDRKHEHGIRLRAAIDRQRLPMRWIIYYGGILAVYIFGVWGPAFDAASFIYGQF
ncbi:MAG: MBOAT family O-acyltransferase [Coriobacteriales bacterium]|nr:MBOAT family O-acyltransferase [Coriobacteriales bacterium]